MGAKIVIKKINVWLPLNSYSSGIRVRINTDVIGFFRQCIVACIAAFIVIFIDLTIDSNLDQFFKFFQCRIIWDFWIRIFSTWSRFHFTWLIDIKFNRIF